jgi:hypothetical protein
MACAVQPNLLDLISTVSSVHRRLLQGACNYLVFNKNFIMSHIFQFTNLLLMRVLQKQSLKTNLQSKAFRSYQKNLVSNSLFNYIECAGDLKCMK